MKEGIAMNQEKIYKQYKQEFAEGNLKAANEKFNYLLKNLFLCDDEIENIIIKQEYYRHKNAVIFKIIYEVYEKTIAWFNTEYLNYIQLLSEIKAININYGLK